MPKVSVIMPVYNTALYLEESIKSILYQTLSDFELLIVDDGSTDGSDAIIKRFLSQDSRIRYRHQENMGQSIARNVALEMATGDYIYFMDSDDVLVKDALQILYSHCDEMGYNILFFDGEILYEKGVSGIAWDYHRTHPFIERQNYKGLDVVDIMLNTYTFRAVPWLYIVKKKCLDSLAMSFFPGIIHEDELFTFLLFVQSDRIGCMKREFIKHRVRNNSTMNISFSMRNIECYLVVIENILEFSRGRNIYKSLVNKYVKYTLNAVCRTSVSLPRKERMALISKCYKLKLLLYISFKNYIRLLIK